MPNPKMSILTVGSNSYDIEDPRIGDLSDLTTTAKSTVVDAINEAAQGGGSSVEPYTSMPAALGTASAGSSDKYARGDHVHAKPSASDIGAVAVAQGVGHAGEFLVVGSNGNVTTVTMTAWSGGNY